MQWLLIPHKFSLYLWFTILAMTEALLCKSNNVLKSKPANNSHWLWHKSRISFWYQHNCLHLQKPSENGTSCDIIHVIWIVSRMFCEFFFLFVSSDIGLQFMKRNSYSETPVDLCQQIHRSYLLYYSYFFFHIKGGINNQMNINASHQRNSPQIVFDKIE